MFYYVYVLKSTKSDKIYIGYTKDLKRRVKEHNEGKNSSTNPFKPYKLIFYEAFLKRSDAKNREFYLKSGYGLRTLKTMLRRYFEIK